jgi:uncharacterized protein (DUF362 family)
MEIDIVIKKHATRGPEDDDVDRTTEGSSHEDPPSERRDSQDFAEMDRRRFLSAAGLTVLGLAAGCTPSSGGSSGSSSATSIATPEASQASTGAASGVISAGWSPVSALSTVSVASDRSARAYPELTPGDAFDQHPAILLLERAIKGVGGDSAAGTLRSAVAEGGTVLIKPNWVEPAKWASGKITHPALVLAVARLASQAVGPSGRVLIGEGTSEGDDLPKVLSATSFLSAMTAFGLDKASASGARVEIVDLNRVSTGAVDADLRNLSRFAHSDELMYDARGKSMGRMGDGRVGVYRIARPVVDADLVIDMAKAKVHCSAGVTLALKNLIGVVPSADGPRGKGGLKDIPHYSKDDNDAGRRYVGNRTIGRTVADLNALVLYLAKDGTLRRSVQRKMLCVIDGVVSGQKNQFNPQTIATGWVVAGFDPVAVDHVTSRCMGFDPARIQSLKPSVAGSLVLGVADPKRVRVVYDGPGGFSGFLASGRRLKPELLTADWGSTIKLQTASLGTPKVSRSGSTLTVRSVPAHAVARLESGNAFVALSRAGDGGFVVELPPSPPASLRIVAVDKHFNYAEEVVAV